MIRKALTIAGSDTCGGAGIQADIKSFSANGVYGMSVITAITVQNTQGVFGIQDVNPDIIEKQIEAIFDDIEVDAIKIGMVSKIESINAIASALKKINKLPPVILDPVMVSKSGFKLLSEDAKETLIKELFPLAEVITPNIPEAEEILGYQITNFEEMYKAAKDLKELGPRYVLVKGGHLEGDAIDSLFDGERLISFKQERINTKNTHGTGCTLSSAIAANVAKGMSMVEAVDEAKKYITVAIEHSIELGKGVGPTNHFYELYKKSGFDVE